tara:strand:- start:1 stop:1284 length:1284 start_codon:yes stop_codon:yes gene_type:complete
MAFKRDKRKGKYWYIDIKPDGTVYGPFYFRRYVHPDGVSRPVRAKDHRDWKEKTAKIDEDAEIAAIVSITNYKNATVLHQSTRYLESLESNTAGNYVRVKGHFNRQIIPNFGNRIVSEITTDEMLQYLKRLTKSNGILVAREVFVVLTAFFRWLVMKKWLIVTPIDAEIRGFIKKRRDKALHKKKKQQDEYPMSEELVASIVADQRGRPEEVILHFFLATGRIGESMGFQSRDYNGITGELSFKRQVQSYPQHMLKGTDFLDEDGISEDTHIAVLDHLKTRASERTVTVVPETQVFLAELQANMEPDDFFFTTRNSTPCTPDNYRKTYWKSMMERLGISHMNITPHSFRGFIHSMGVNHGGDSWAISQALGHSQNSTTTKYYSPKLKEQAKDNPIKHISKVFGQAEDILNSDVDKDSSITIAAERNN